MFNLPLNDVIQSGWQTLLMVFVSGLAAAVFGLPLGLLMVLTRSNHVCPQRLLNRFFSIIIDVIRSVPFIILLVAIIPLTRLIVGTSIGTPAAIVPLALAAIPFYARITEAAILAVPAGLLEAAYSLGASVSQIVRHFLLPEALPALVRGLTLTLITLVGYSAMAGAVGGGGLGDLAIQYGYERFQPLVMLVTVAILVLFVALLQWAGDRWAKRLSHEK